MGGVRVGLEGRARPGPDRTFPTRYRRSACFRRFAGRSQSPKRLARRRICRSRRLLTISGFLITGLIADEIDRTGGFSIKRFYIRRARRYPARRLRGAARRPGSPPASYSSANGRTTPSSTSGGASASPPTSTSPTAAPVIFRLISSRPRCSQLLVAGGGGTILSDLAAAAAGGHTVGPQAHRSACRSLGCSGSRWQEPSRLSASASFKRPATRTSPTSPPRGGPGS